jgi:hypothetical protein
VTERTGVVSGRRCVWVTSTVDGADHAMTDKAMAAGLAAKRGVFLAVCSASVVAAPMIAPPGQPCARCQAFVHPQLTPRVVPVRRRRVGWLSGWWRG